MTQIASSARPGRRRSRPRRVLSDQPQVATMQMVGASDALLSFLQLTQDEIASLHEAVRQTRWIMNVKRPRAGKTPGNADDPMASRKPMSARYRSNRRPVIKMGEKTAKPPVSRPTTIPATAGVRG